MLTMFSVLSSVVAAAEPIGQRATEVPELASMALLSIVLAGLSVVVRRTGPKAVARPATHAATPTAPSASLAASLDAFDGHRLNRDVLGGPILPPGLRLPNRANHLDALGNLAKH